VTKSAGGGEVKCRNAETKRAGKTKLEGNRGVIILTEENFETFFHTSHGTKESQTVGGKTIGPLGVG